MKMNEGRTAGLVFNDLPWSSSGAFVGCKMSSDVRVRCPVTPWRRAMPLVLLVLITVLAAVLRASIGDTAMILLGLPLIMAGRSCGVRGILVVGGATLVATGLLFWLHDAALGPFLLKTLPGLGLSLLIACGASRLRDLVHDAAASADQLQAEIDCRETVEEILRHDRDLMRVYIDTAQVALVVLDVNGRIELANAGCARLVGRSAEELAGADWFESFVPSDRRSKGRAVFEQLVAGAVQPVAGAENEVLTRTGERRLVRWNVSLLRDHHGQVTGTLGVGEDITDRRQMEAALRLEEERLRSICECGRDAIVMLDTSGAISYWNPAATTTFGWSAAEALGKDVHQLLAPPEMHAAYPGPFAQFQRTGRGGAINRTLELTARHRDGSVLPVEVSLAGVQVAGGYQAVGIIRDIRVRKEAEAKLREASAAAEAAAREKADFLANMSHELRTPMNAVIGMTSLLLDSPLTAEQREMVETIRLSGQAQLEVINEVLDFSKIDAGKLELEQEDFDLIACVEEAVELTNPVAVNKGLKLATHFADDVPQQLRGDPGRLRQVLVNLIHNAVKFTPAGSVTLSMSLAERSAAGWGLCFAVRDTGIGLSPKNAERLFRPFTQADASTARKHGGTGLGLSICRSLVELMGGRIWVESDGEGKGAIFTFTAQFAAADQVLQTPPPAQLRGIKVLVIEADPFDRNAIVALLVRWEMTPFAFATPAVAAQARLSAHRFPLAVVDLAGAEAIVSGRLPGSTAGATVVLANGRAEAPPGLRWVTRPLRASSLYDQIAEAMERGPAAPVPVTAGIDRELGRRHRLRILLAEDNAVNQKVALKILERLGYMADVAANGVEAVAAVERQIYDLVLMDVQMPEVDGLEATRRIRRCLPVEAQPCIVAMTAGAFAKDRQECLDAGMDGYLGKPVRIEELTAALRRCKPLASSVSARVAVG